MKKLIATLCCVLTMSVSTLASDINVYVNNSKMNFPQQPVIENGTTLVPMRTILEKLGASVSWDNDTRTVTTALDFTTVKMTIDSTTAYEGSKIVALPVAPKLINGTTMIPLRFISERFGLKVDWNSTTRTASITNNSYAGFTGIPDFGKENNLTALSGSGNVTVSGTSKIVDFSYDGSKVTDAMLSSYVKELEGCGFTKLTDEMYYVGAKDKKVIVSVDKDKNVVITINVL